MSEVKRYTESCMEGGGVCPSRDGEFVTFLDYDAAQSELAALREELDGCRAANMGLRDELKTERLRGDAAVGDANEAERSLTAAEQRNAALEGWVRKYREVLRSRRYADNDEGDYWARADHREIQMLDAALKPTESGASDE